MNKPVNHEFVVVKPDDIESSSEGQAPGRKENELGEAEPKRSSRTWTTEEDEQIGKFVRQFGTRKWTTVSMFLKRYTGKQCRERWHNHLNPDIRRDRWSKEEDETIVREHMARGTRWSEIAKSLPGRTDNAIKNRWNSTMRRVCRHIKAMQSGNTPGRRISLPSGEESQLYPYCLSLVQNNSDDITMPMFQDHNPGVRIGEVYDAVKHPDHSPISIPIPIRPVQNMGVQKQSIQQEPVVSQTSFETDGLPVPIIDEKLLGAAQILFQSASPNSSVVLTDNINSKIFNV